jgi:hypothetical protein
VSRYAAAFSETKSSFQENQRLEVPRVFPEAAIEGTRTHVHNVSVEFLFNLDKIAISEGEDRVDGSDHSIGHKRTKDFSWNSPRIEVHLSGDMYLSSWQPHNPFSCFFSSDRCYCSEAEN